MTWQAFAFTRMVYAYMFPEVGEIELKLVENANHFNFRFLLNRTAKGV